MTSCTRTHPFVPYLVCPIPIPDSDSDSDSVSVSVSVSVTGTAPVVARDALPSLIVH